MLYDLLCSEAHNVHKLIRFFPQCCLRLHASTCLQDIVRQSSALFPPDAAMTFPTSAGPASGLGAASLTAMGLGPSQASVSGQGAGSFSLRPGSEAYQAAGGSAALSSSVAANVQGSGAAAGAVAGSDMLAGLMGPMGQLAVRDESPSGSGSGGLPVAMCHHEVSVSGVADPVTGNKVGMCTSGYVPCHMQLGLESGKAGDVKPQYNLRAGYMYMPTYLEHAGCLWTPSVLAAYLFLA